MPACTRSSCASSAKASASQRIEGKIVEVKTDPTSGYITAIRLDSGARHRRRPVHRLHRLPRPADRTGAARRLRGLVALALQRQRHRAADRIRRATPGRTRARSRARPAGNGAFRCSIASATASSTAAATSATTQAKQTLLANVEGKVLTEPRVDQVPPGPASRALEEELHRGRPGQRLHRAAGVDQHPPDPAQHHPPDADVPAHRHPAVRHRRVQPADELGDRAHPRFHRAALPRDQSPGHAVLAGRAAT